MLMISYCESLGTFRHHLASILACFPRDWTHLGPILTILHGYYDLQLLPVHLSKFLVDFIGISMDLTGLF